METSSILSWTLIGGCQIPDHTGPLLVEGERAVAAYKTFRDSAVFTTHRLLVRDAQGVRGKKVEIYSLPYSVDPRRSHQGDLQKGVDIRRFDRLIADAALGGLS